MPCAATSPPSTHGGHLPHRPSISIHVNADGPPGGAWSPGPAGAADQRRGAHGTPTFGHKKRPARIRRMAGPGRAVLIHLPDTP